MDAPFEVVRENDAQSFFLSETGKWLTQYVKACVGAFLPNEMRWQLS